MGTAPSSGAGAQDNSAFCHDAFAVIPKELLAALRTIEIYTARLANEQLSGTYTSSFKGQGLAFREVRPYQPGDDVRSIDWNVSARMNDAFVKVFVEEREMTVMLVADLSGSERFGTRRAAKVRVASEVAALLAFSAIRNNDRVGLIVATDKIERMVPPKKGEKHVMRVVREILGFEPSSDEAEAGPRRHDERRGSQLGARTNLHAALEALVRTSRRRSVAFVISDFYDTGYERALALASAKHDVVPVVLVDPRDFELPDVGLATFEDLESGESVIVDTGDARVRTWYAQSMKRIGSARRGAFHKLGLDSVEIETGGSFVRPLRDLFARRARRIRR